MVYEIIKEEYCRINKEVEEIQDKLKELPTGTLQCIHDGKYLRWYRCEEKIRKYIPKKNRELAERLAYKKYLLNQISNLKQEKTAIEYYLKHHRSQKENEILNPTSPYYQLLKTYFMPINEEQKNWINEPFKRNEKYKEQLINKSISGNVVRSKSEMMIDMYLYMNKIPFRYECILHLKELDLFPDFTIMHPTTGKLYYWEHFGLMDNPEYCKNVCSKIQLYASNNIIPTINLIMTFETKEYPLNTETIEKIVKEYFG